MIGEILQLAGQYFVSSSMWVWNLVVVLVTVGLWILWLFVGGALSLPVLVRVAGWVTLISGPLRPFGSITMSLGFPKVQSTLEFGRM